MNDAPVVVIAGPTASGKSGLALEIAEALTGSIVNADSMQVYADLRILTARPTDDERVRRPGPLPNEDVWREAISPDAAVGAAYSS